MWVQLVGSLDGRPQHFFKCPHSRDCPAMKLSSTATNASIGCPNNHDGPLCASCDAGFSRRGSSDNGPCDKCDSISDYIAKSCGLSAKNFTILEPFGATFYGLMLLTTMGILLASAVMLTIAQVRRRHRLEQVGRKGVTRGIARQRELVDNHPGCVGCDAGNAPRSLQTVLDLNSG